MVFRHLTYILGLYCNACANLSNQRRAFALAQGNDGFCELRNYLAG